MDRLELQIAVCCAVLRGSYHSKQEVVDGGGDVYKAIR